MKAKRSLGQNFFVNKNLGDYIVNTLRNTSCDTVVEIGPGLGFFTERLQSIFNDVVVVEKDSKLANSLHIQYPNIKVINDDILNINLDNIIDKDVLFFGSLPFNISKAIIKKIIESKHFVFPAFCIIQKEVADKYIYKQPYSRLSLTTAIYADYKKIVDISPESFRPKPNVYSSLVQFTPNNISIEKVVLLKELISSAFRQPRKNIYNNLKGTQFEKGIDKFKTLRPAQLSLVEYISICKYSH